MTRTAIVTGGASGIGLATVRRLVEEGWRVAAIDIDDTALSRASDELAGEVMVRKTDVSDEAAVDRTVDEIAGAFGRLDGLVNCAGIAGETPFAEIDVERFRRILDVNLVGTFLVSRAALRHLGAGGAIINMASVSGLRGNSGRAAYGASKGGIITMTQMMAVELAGRGIHVNALAPGPIDTPMVAAHHTASTRDEWMRMIPAGRYGLPPEVADLIVFLLSGSAAYITGQVIAIDGGFLAAGVGPSRD